VLGLTTFETRMLMADLIQVFKILHNIDRVDKFFFTFALNNTMGHSLKLYKSRFVLDINKFAFLKTVSLCVSDIWNHLPDDIVSAASLNILKNKLDRHLQINWGLK